jgi:hypothetical protein
VHPPKHGDWRAHCEEGTKTGLVESIAIPFAMVALNTGFTAQRNSLGSVNHFEPHLFRLFLNRQIFNGVHWVFVKNASYRSPANGNEEAVFPVTASDPENGRDAGVSKRFSLPRRLCIVVTI